MSRIKRRARSTDVVLAQEGSMRSDERRTGSAEGSPLPGEDIGGSEGEQWVLLTPATRRHACGIPRRDDTPVESSDEMGHRAADAIAASCPSVSASSTVWLCRCDDRGLRSLIHLTADPERERETALTTVQTLLDDESDRIEQVVVAQGPGIVAVETDSSKADDVRRLLDQGVSFRACRQTMQRQELSDGDIVDGVAVVPAGAVEVTQLRYNGHVSLRP